MDYIYDQLDEYGAKALTLYAGHQGWTAGQTGRVAGAYRGIVRRRPPSPPITPRKRKKINHASSSSEGSITLPGRENSSPDQIIMGKFKRKVIKKRTGYKKKAYSKAKKSFRKKYKKVKRQSFAKKVHAVMDKTEAVGTYRYVSTYPLRCTQINQWNFSYPTGAQLSQIGGTQRIADAEAVLFKGKTVAAAGWNTPAGNFSYNHKVTLKSCGARFVFTNDTQFRMTFELYKFVPKKSTNQDPLGFWNSIYNDEAAGTHTGTNASSSIAGLSTVHTDSQALKEFWKTTKTVFDMQPGGQYHYSVNLKGKLINWEKVVSANTDDTNPATAVYPFFDPQIPTALIAFRWRPHAHATTLASVGIPAATGTGGSIAVEQFTTTRMLCPEIADSNKNVVTFTSYNDLPSGAIGSPNVVEMMNPVTVVNNPQ